jgi:hypothetical protein
MLGELATYVSGFIQQICDNGTIAVKQYFHRNSPGIGGENLIAHCLIDICWENSLGEKLELVVTAMQEFEKPMRQVAKNYGIGDAVRSVAGDAVVDTVGDLFKQIMPKQNELIYVFVGVALCELGFRLYRRLNEQTHHTLPNLPVMPVNPQLPPAVQTNFEVNDAVLRVANNRPTHRLKYGR